MGTNLSLGSISGDRERVCNSSSCLEESPHLLAVAVCSSVDMKFELK